MNSNIKEYTKKNGETVFQLRYYLGKGKYLKKNFSNIYWAKSLESQLTKAKKFDSLDDFLSLLKQDHSYAVFHSFFEWHEAKHEKKQSEIKKDLKNKTQRIRDLEKAKKLGVDDLICLSPEKIEDIRLALSRLPEGESLCDAVDALMKSKELRIILKRPKTHFESLVDAFISHLSYQDYSKEYFAKLKRKVNFFKTLKSLDSCEEDILKKRIKQYSPRTQQQYICLLKSFKEWIKKSRYVPTYKAL